VVALHGDLPCLVQQQAVHFPARLDQVPFVLREDLSQPQQQVGGLVVVHCGNSARSGGNSKVSLWNLEGMSPQGLQTRVSGFNLEPLR